MQDFPRLPSVCKNETPPRAKVIKYSVNCLCGQKLSKALGKNWCSLLPFSYLNQAPELARSGRSRTHFGSNQYINRLCPLLAEARTQADVCIMDGGIEYSGVLV